MRRRDGAFGGLNLLVRALPCRARLRLSRLCSVEHRFRAMKLGLRATFCLLPLAALFCVTIRLKADTTSATIDVRLKADTTYFGAWRWYVVSGFSRTFPRRPFRFRRT